MKPLRSIALLVAFAFVAVLPASASAALTATKVRIGSHTGFVRVVIDFSGGTITDNNVELASGTIDSTGNARLEIAKAGAMTTAATMTASGARVSIVRDSTGLRVRIRANAHRFKFLGYQVMHSPERLVIDLYRRASHATVSRGGCLKINSTTTSTSRKVVARGTVVVRIFENTFRVRLRRSSGAVVAARTVTTATATGPWSAELRHTVTPRQTGVVEAVAFSAKDGAVQCFYQRPVTLRP
jgi:hypothetical protein